MVNLEWNHFGPIPPAEPDAKASAEKLYLDLKEAFPGYVADFERKFTAWKDKWHDGEMRFANNASDRCNLDEYEPLLFLGPEIIPLVVYELTKPENFFATALYNHLESHPSAKVSRHDTLNHLTLQRHANLIVDLNHQRAQRARACLQAWKEAQQQQQHNPDPDPDTTAAREAYAALVEMGPGIAALVMLAYREDQAGPWDRVMHRLVCEEEQPMGVVDVDAREKYGLWRDWMEEREERHETVEGGERGYLYNFWIRPEAGSGEGG